ncbi:hypothetical protein LAh8_54 [Aeromonas phage LAh_8]|uniref:Uncharacterized protein n=1 Tax=Aeromonas phage LAh_8 TaxID=2591032 RepID=A0A514A0Q9_9CAUD|nr:hypothetical protein HWC31_gp054 [Aeromonas phage LAh_8]QDH46836.1 hypothetical protein LAh8_54 [Aeromonas phage LAh_8]
MQSNLCQVMNLLKAKGIDESKSREILKRRLSGNVFWIPKSQEVWIDKTLPYVPTALELKRQQWLFS